MSVYLNVSTVYIVKAIFRTLHSIVQPNPIYLTYFYVQGQAISGDDGKVPLAPQVWI